MDQRFNFHLPRQVLRQLILEALLPGTIVWNTEFKSYEKNDDDDDSMSALTINFSSSMNSNTESSINKKTIEYKVKTNILVGADGIWSSVRKCKFGIVDHLSREIGTRYLGVMVILGRASIDHELTDCSQYK